MTWAAYGLWASVAAAVVLVGLSWFNYRTASRYWKKGYVAGMRGAVLIANNEAYRTGQPAAMRPEQNCVRVARAIDAAVNTIEKTRR